MLANSVYKPVCVLLTICMVLGAASYTTEAAISCTEIDNHLSACIPHLKSRAPARSTPPVKCCAGVKSIKAMATKTDEHRAVCECMKSTAAAIKGFNFDLAAKLPARCGTKLPYIFSPITDCSKVVG